VVVTAVRPKEQILLDRRVYSVATDLQAVTGTAADILNQIPSVDVDANGNISLRGDPNVTCNDRDRPLRRPAIRSDGHYSDTSG
jgi:hypothetical protein